MMTPSFTLAALSLAVAVLPPGPSSAAARAEPPLAGTCWLATELGGRAIPPQEAAHPLQGTSWRLVKFEGGDGTTVTPDDRSKYTLEFQDRGRLATRIDCNRGSGAWTTSGPAGLTFGPLALTRAQCPPGSLHDLIVNHWPLVRSYVLEKGHLFLSLMADGGTYEFEPTPRVPSP
jgi:heat shock protein HslJ